MPRRRCASTARALLIDQLDDRAAAERHVPDSEDVNPRSTEQPKTTDPRIEDT